MSWTCAVFLGTEEQAKRKRKVKVEVKVKKKKKEKGKFLGVLKLTD